MNVLWFGPTHEEIDEVASGLIARHGADAPEEALRLYEAYRSLGALRNKRVALLAARKCALLLEGATAAANDNLRGGEAVLREE